MMEMVSLIPWYISGAGLKTEYLLRYLYGCIEIGISRGRKRINVVLLVTPVGIYSFYDIGSLVVGYCSHLFGGIGSYGIIAVYKDHGPVADLPLFGHLLADAVVAVYYFYVLVSVIKPVIINKPVIPVKNGMALDTVTGMKVYLHPVIGNKEMFAAS